MKSERKRLLQRRVQHWIVRGSKSRSKNELPRGLRNGLQRNLTALAATLFTLLILTWAGFYALASGLLRDDAKTRAQLASAQIIDNLTRELSGLEQSVSTLAAGDLAKRFVSENDLAKRYDYADEIIAGSAANALGSGFLNHALIYDLTGSFYRLAGNLSYSSCVSLGYLLSRSSYPGHIVRESEGVTYIGYVAGIYDENDTRIGAVVILTERENILDIVRMTAPDRSLLVSVMAGDESIAESYDEAPNRMQTLSTKQVGLTPFSVRVAIDEQRVNTSVRWFTLAAAITALIFILLLITFLRLLNRRFFKPMITVIGHVKTLGDGEAKRRLPLVDGDEFDALILGVNDMLDRLDKGSARLRMTEAKLQNNEIQKQKAIIFSLKKQINAHFTINTLSTVQTLADRGEIDAASQILSKLSSLIRYAYAEDERIGVWEELKIMNDYIDVMNIRYDHKITTIINADDRLMDYRMPRMLLQPIVENAITHGFRNRTLDCSIFVCAELIANRIRISITDNGDGMSEDALVALRARLDADDENAPDGLGGIALVNIRRQLRSFYGDDASIAIESTYGQNTIVTLQFPTIHDSKIPSSSFPKN
ncbi:MAG: histidine kinase [Clostridium sp.]|jgi:sensor histidine kinase YesM|nr:histidine kinase [Clostridium sp.]